MDRSTLDVNRHTATIVECHGNLCGVTNRESLPVRDRFQREGRWKSGGCHATILNQNPRRVETSEDRLLLLRRGRRNTRILAREIVPNNTLSSQRSLPLRLV